MHLTASTVSAGPAPLSCWGLSGLGNWPRTTQEMSSRRTDGGPQMSSAPLVLADSADDRSNIIIFFPPDSQTLPVLARLLLETSQKNL